MGLRSLGNALDDPQRTSERPESTGTQVDRLAKQFGDKAGGGRPPTSAAGDAAEQRSGTIISAPIRADAHAELPSLCPTGLLAAPCGGQRTTADAPAPPRLRAGIAPLIRPTPRQLALNRLMNRAARLHPPRASMVGRSALAELPSYAASREPPACLATQCDPQMRHNLAQATGPASVRLRNQWKTFGENLSGTGERGHSEHNGGWRSNALPLRAASLRAGFGDISTGLLAYPRAPQLRHRPPAP